MALLPTTDNLERLEWKNQQVCTLGELTEQIWTFAAHCSTLMKQRLFVANN